MRDSSIFGGVFDSFDEVRVLAERATLMEKARGLRKDVEALKKKGQVDAARKRYGEFLQVQKRLGEIAAGQSAVAVKRGQSVGAGVGKLATQAAAPKGADYGLARAGQTDVGGHPLITPLEQNYLRDRMTSSSDSGVPGQNLQAMARQSAVDAAAGAAIGQVTPRHPSDTIYDGPKRSTSLQPKGGSGGQSDKGGSSVRNSINNLPLTSGQRDLAKIGSGELGLMAEGYWGMIKGVGQNQADQAQTAANHVAKPVADYIRIQLPNGLLRPDLEKEMRKLGMDGKVWAETIKGMDPTQFPAFVEAITQEADANGQTGVAKMGHGLLDMMRRIGEGDEDAGAQLLGMWNAFAFSVATAKTVGGGLKPTTNPFAKFSKFSREYIRPKNVSGPHDWEAARAHEARVASKADEALLAESLQKPLGLENRRNIRTDRTLMPRTAEYIESVAPKWPRFAKGVESFAKKVGGKAHVAPLKGKERTAQKAFKVKDQQFVEIDDVLRATIEVDDYPEWASLVELMKRSYNVIKAENRVKRPIDGYQDYKFTVKLDDGQLAEIQVNVPEIIEAKKVAHSLYQKARVLPGKKAKPLNREQEAIYRAAREKFHKRINARGNGQ